jgi:hypothetical protein
MEVVRDPQKRPLMTHRRLLLRTVLALAFLSSAYAADVTGKWAAEFDTAIGVQKYTYDLKADPPKLTGKAIGRFGETEIQEGKVSGDEISFVEMLKFEGQDLRIEYTGKVSGDEIKFTRKVGDFATEEFVAKRAK